MAQKNEHIYIFNIVTDLTFIITACVCAKFQEKKF